ncbi:MAG: efflux RND transporter periplasmic adaptor subunit [Desulfobulbaceae bacterium]|nr:efflux RND transporter periplasmic adaptor subunit [Desulfobulbaceae bacterium]
MKNILCIVLLLLAFSPALAAEPPAMPPAQVVTAKVTERETAATSDMIGVLYFEKISKLSGEISGLAAEVKVSEGDTVSRGQVLIRLDTELLDKERELQQASIGELQVKMEQVQKDISRYAELIKSNATSEKAYDDLLFDYREFEMQKLTRQRALEKLQIQKEKSVIRSPFNGIVLAKNVEAGSWVVPGSAVLTIGSTGDLYVGVAVSEEMLQFVENGAKLPVHINALNRDVEGVFVGIKPVADAKTKNIVLKVKLPDLANIAENMSAVVAVPVSPRRQLRIIPRDALVEFQGKNFIYTIKDGAARIMKVHIVAYLGREVGVDDEHIKPGMPVVVDGNDRLRPDQPVKVVGEK